MMDVTDLASRLLRRRFAATVILLLAVVAAAAAWSGAGSSEQSSSAVVIVPPALGDSVVEQNPLLNLDNNLAQLAVVLATSMSSADVTDTLQAGGATAPYTVATESGSNPSFAQLSPQIVFTVTASSAQLAVRTSTALVFAAQERLDALQAQAGTADDARARLVTVVEPTAAVSAGSGRLRAAGAVGLGVAILGLLGLLLVDELISRRSPAKVAGETDGELLAQPYPEPGEASEAERTVPEPPAPGAGSRPATADPGRVEPADHTWPRGPRADA